MRKPYRGTVLMPTDKTIPEPGDLSDAGLEEEGNK
jgi:hypothetical protein